MCKHSKRIPVPEDDHTTDEGQLGFRRRKRALALVFIGILVVCFIVCLAIGLTFKGKERSLNLKRRSDKEVKIAPYGSWKSPLSSSVVSGSSISFHDLRVDPKNPDFVYWTELHPDEGGIDALYSFRNSDQQLMRWTTKSMSLTTRVHEYGGGSFIVHNNVIYFVDHSGQQIHMLSEPLKDPTPLTKGKGMRYADCDFHSSANKLICVREDHSVVESGTSKEAQNTIVVFDIASQTENVVVSGSDFYASPKVSPNGKELVWMQWSHPNMPWDDTQIYKGEFNESCSRLKPSSITKVEGHKDLNVMHPRWSPDGKVVFISDESNWWNIYKEGPPHRNLYPKDADFGAPQWSLGCNLFSVADNGDIAFMDEKMPSIIKAKDGKIEKLPSNNYNVKNILFSPDGRYVYAVGSNPVSHNVILRIEVKTGEVKILKAASVTNIDKGYLSEPQKITFPTGKDKKSFASGYLYLPKNKDFKGPNGTLPPLLIQAHGGPTAAASLALDLNIQYYTSRGFAVFDVDYRGSTGYGRKYRISLYGNWGVYDMEDCANGALYLANEKKLVDPKRLAISGGSAGGYTVLASLTFTDVFAVGSSHYGISDIVILMNETHKFESRYIDTLIAPGAAGLRLARERSPIYHLDKLKKPIAFFQGELDKVVPPNQAQIMFDAIKKKGLPCAFVLFKGEYHGFAKAESRQKALDGEFYFFSKLMKFEAADNGIEIKIENLD